jgi:hypothetical protein
MLSSRQLYAGHRLVSKQGLFQTLPRLQTHPGFDDIIKVSTRQHRFSFIRLLSMHLTKSSLAFSHNAHYHGFWPKQLMVVWNHYLYSESEGPALIFFAA